MELAHRSLGEQFLWFSKNDLLWFNRIFLLFEKKKYCIFQIFLLRGIKAYLCPNIINFDSVDFSEPRPEEVISFFWRSVYIINQLMQYETVISYVVIYETITYCIMSGDGKNYMYEHFDSNLSPENPGTLFLFPNLITGMGGGGG